MNRVETFGECLNALMHKNHISVARLTQLVNYRSKTSLARLLRDEVRYGSIVDFMERLEQAEDSLFSEREMEALRQSMEVSRLGRGRWSTYQSIWKLLRGELEERQVSIECFGMARACSARELTEKWFDACKLDILMINSGLDSMMSQVERLLCERPDLPCRVRHYLTMRDEPGSMAVQLGTLMGVVHDARYQVYCRVARQGVGEDYEGEGYHSVMVEGKSSDGSSFFQMIFMKSADRWLLYENEKAETFMPFVNSFLSELWRDVLAMKVEYPGSNLLEGLISISQRYLSCERNRATCCLAPAVCFELIPTQILYEVMFDSVLEGFDPNHPDVQALCEVHQARYENICTKGAPSTFIFHWDSMQRFAETGCTTDHVAGMRPFSKEERRRILDDLVRRCRENEQFNIYILRPEVGIKKMTLTTHDELGVYLLDIATQYDLQNGHSEVFISVPSLAEALDEFFGDELIEKCTYSKEESLSMLCALRDSIGE